MKPEFSRSARVLGEDAVKKLNNSSVIVFGLGGVGGAAAESLVRGGVGTVGIVDKDAVDVTNINRQIISTAENIGLPKTEVCKNRLKSINPDVNIHTYNMFYLPENASEIDLTQYDFIVDCIDNVTAKLELICRANSLGVPVISSMGTGNKLYPEMLKIADIKKTSVCPLARVMRRELRSRGVNKLTVVYSEEEPVKTHSAEPGSTSFVPPVAGYIMGGYVIRKLTNIE